MIVELRCAHCGIVLPIQDIDNDPDPGGWDWYVMRVYPHYCHVDPELELELELEPELESALDDVPF